MDLLITILTCSLYASDDALVRAIAEGPSESNPYAVLDPAVNLSEVDAVAPPRTAKDATARAADLAARGARPLLGLLELPAVWLETFGRPLASAFDPCTNVAIGSAMLSEFDFECAAKGAPGNAWAQSLERTNRRVCVLRKYEAAIGVTDFADAVLLEISAQRARSPAVAEAPIFTPKASSPWGPDQLLFPLLAPFASAPPASRR